jgi:ABC-type glycerol-3-phosphate transport system substrate-binding protein
VDAADLSGEPGAAVAAGGALAACRASSSATGGGPSAGAQPSLQNGKIVLAMRAWGVGSGAMGNPKTIDQILYQATQPWRDKHPGVDIRIVENTGGPQAVIAAILSGTGPDIYHSWHPNVMFSSDGYTADLTPYLRQSNADLSVFNKAQMSLFITPTGIRALPYYLGIMTMAVNEGLLDQAGLPYPEPGWTHEDYARLATAVTRSAPAGKHIWGGSFGLGNLGANSSTLPPACILAGFGGSYVRPDDPTKCNLDAPGSVAAVEWAYGLAKAKVITGPGVSADFATGTLAMTWAPSFFLPQAATGWKGLKWRYYPMPSFPVTGPTTGATSDLWAMNPETKYPELAWDLLHWCAFEPEWQRSQMDIFLLSPALLHLWDEWLTRVPQIAPPLADKGLKAFADQARGNRAYPQQFFRYAAPQADALIDSWGQQMWNDKVGIREGLAQLTRQVNALEEAATAQAQRATDRAQRFPTTGPAMAPVPAGI